MGKKLLIAVTFIVLLPALAGAYEITICDLASETSQAGTRLVEILDGHGYAYSYYQSIGGHTGDMMVLFAGVQEYGQGGYVEEEQLQNLRDHLNAGKDVLIFGSSNLLMLPLSMIGVDIMTLDPLPVDSLWGTEFNFLDGLVFNYPEENFAPQGSYFIASSEFNPDFEALHGNWGGSPLCKGVFYQNSSPSFKALTFNADPSLIDPDGEYDSYEDLILRSLQDYFHIYTDIDEEAPPVPAETRLEQNYPNPFNNNTVISFCLPEAGEVKLNIYDIMGREVSCILENRLAAGEHRAVFDGNELASGIYYYILDTEAGNYARKMSLIK
ncbi:MAG: T9SS type A sorting domain-containing protein [candidate division Zixibacteria bacterium]|nr:T9SS type A sorting domain-containing protein [candidate division Zixibacteria bacterium]